MTGLMEGRGCIAAVDVKKAPAEKMKAAVKKAEDVDLELELGSAPAKKTSKRTVAAMVLVFALTTLCGGSVELLWRVPPLPAEYATLIPHAAPLRAAAPAWHVPSH